MISELIEKMHLRVSAYVIKIFIKTYPKYCSAIVALKGKNTVFLLISLD